MKKRVLTLCLLASAVTVCAQTRSNKINLSAGGGFENYSGDLGNTFFKTHEEVYGFVTVRLGYYLNSSLDVVAYGTKGDFGHCRDWGDDPTHLDMRSRMTSFNIALKYKFANGYLLKENSKISPFISIGAGNNNLRDIWTNDRVNTGNYFSINGGAGLCYNFTERYSLGYNIAFGYFTSDNLDYIVQGRNDIYMQNAFSLGINF